VLKYKIFLATNMQFYHRSKFLEEKEDENR